MRPVSNRAAWTPWLVVSLVVLLVLGGCRLAGPRPTLGATNFTDIPIELMLKGESLATVEPGADMEIASRSRMPALPWEIEARTETGRVVVAMTVTAEDLARTSVKDARGDRPYERFTMSAGDDSAESGP